MVVAELLSQLGHADGGKGQQRRRTLGQLSVDLGSHLLGLRGGLRYPAADRLAAITVVEPPGAVMQINGYSADAEAFARGPLTGRHGTISRARIVHQACTRECSREGQKVT